MMPFAYAEMHYQIIPGFFSRYFKSEPEIIIDAPWRLEPHKSLPILLYLKDAHRFPLYLHDLNIELQSSRFSKTIHFEIDEFVVAKFWHKLLYIDASGIDRHQRVSLTPHLSYRKKRKERILEGVDNTGHGPLSLTCYLADQPLRISPNSATLDLHVHSNYTEDQIEFGPPLKAMSVFAEAIGLSAIGVTDHSYDLDDSPSSYLQPDKTEQKWRYFLRDVASFNKNRTIFYGGQETSVASAKKRNIHLQVFDSAQLLSGSGDSGEKWFCFMASPRMLETLNGSDSESLFVPSHIGEKPALYERLLINRGHYESKDLRHEKIKHVQILNGSNQAEFNTAKKMWIRLLEKNPEILPLAGSDSHGHFNFNRQVRIPHWSIRHTRTNLLGSAFTVVMRDKVLEKPLSDNLADLLANGFVYISTGPFIELILPSGKHHCSRQNVNKVEYIRFKSTREYGPIVLIAGYCCKVGQTEELFLSEKTNTYEYSHYLETGPIDLSYIRFELYTEHGYMALTPALLPQLIESANV
jgi:hypothetical protein